MTIYNIILAIIGGIVGFMLLKGTDIVCVRLFEKYSDMQIKMIQIACYMVLLVIICIGGYLLIN